MSLNTQTDGHTYIYTCVPLKGRGVHSTCTHTDRSTQINTEHPPDCGFHWRLTQTYVHPSPHPLIPHPLPPHSTPPTPLTTPPSSTLNPPPHPTPYPFSTLKPPTPHHTPFLHTPYHTARLGPSSYCFLQRRTCCSLPGRSSLCACHSPHASGRALARAPVGREGVRAWGRVRAGEGVRV